MKPAGMGYILGAMASLPLRGAWIETDDDLAGCVECEQSLPLRGAWIETISCRTCGNASLSLPLRGAWIETSMLRTVNTTVPGRSPCGGRGLKLGARVGCGALP